MFSNVTFDTRLALPPIQPFSLTPERINQQPEVADPNTPVFETFFNAALGMINDTNTLQIQADQLQLDLATGRTDDILAVQMAQDRAFTAINFTIQVTNRIVESYREIMRMQM